PHRDGGDEEKEEEPVEDVPSQEDLHHRSRRPSGPAEGVQDQPEDEAVQEEERGHHDVGDGRDEVSADLAKADLPDPAHRTTSVSPLSGRPRSGPSGSPPSPSPR